MIDPLTFGLGAVGGGASALAVWGLLRWATRHSSPDPGAAGPPPGTSASFAPSVPDGARAVAERPRTPVWLTVPRDQVRLSERVIVELARQGRLTPDATVEPGRTQAGLVRALGSNQSAVSKVLRRLVDAAVVDEERRHVRGGSRRVKAYALTRRGEMIARDIAERAGVSLLPPMDAA